MSHADTVAEITADNQAGILRLQGLYGFKTGTTRRFILRNGPRMAEYTDKIRLHIRWELQYFMEILQHIRLHFLI